MHASGNNVLQEYEMEGQTLEAGQQKRDLRVIITSVFTVTKIETKTVVFV